VFYYTSNLCHAYQAAESLAELTGLVIVFFAK